VVSGQQLETALPQPVNPRVTDVSDRDSAVAEERDRQGGAHARARGIRRAVNPRDAKKHSHIRGQSRGKRVKMHSMRPA